MWGSLADTATHFATAWHCFVHASLFLNFVTLENYRGLLHPTSTKAVDELLPVVRDLQAICFFFSFSSPLRKIL